MLRALFRGGFIGGLVAFLWTAFSWSVFSWHQAGLHALPDEAAAQAFLRQAAPESGVYLLPNPHRHGAELSADSLTARLDRQLAASRGGPVAFLAVRAEGQDPAHPAWFLNTLLIHLGGAVLLALLVLPLGGQPFWRRWLTVELAVLAGAWLTLLPAWNWWHAGPAWTLTLLADLLAGWGIAGLVIAWGTGPGSRFTRPSA